MLARPRPPGTSVPPAVRPQAGPEVAEPRSPGAHSGSPGAGRAERAAKKCQPELRWHEAAPPREWGQGAGGKERGWGGAPCRTPCSPRACRCCGQGPPPQAINTPAARPRLTPPQLRLEQQDPHNIRADVPEAAGSALRRQTALPRWLFPNGREVPELGVGSNCAGTGAGLSHSLEGTMCVCRGGDGGVSQAEGTAGGEGFTSCARPGSQASRAPPTRSPVP